MPPSSGVLLDTHALMWLANDAPFRPAAKSASANAALNGRLFTLAISPWEMAFALRKKNPLSRPNLGGRTPLGWFLEASQRLAAQVLPLSPEICAEAADVPTIIGWRDPGDCFLIATARILDLTLVTRDRRILDLARTQSTYLTALAC